MGGETTSANKNWNKGDCYLYPITMSYEGTFSLGILNFFLKADTYFIETHKEVANSTGVRTETNPEVIFCCMPGQITQRVLKDL
jgi:hypothetical protein